MKRPGSTTQFLTILAMAYTSGCATITVHADPMAREAGRPGDARVILYGSKANIDNMKIYENGAAKPLSVVMVNNPTFGQALSNSTRQTVAQQAANASGVSQEYTTTERYSPAIFLKTKGTHTLRLVRSDGKEVTVVTKPHVGMRYVIIDWLLIAPTFFTSILIDWSTGKWGMYDAIQVNQYFPAPVNAQGGTK